MNKLNLSIVVPAHNEEDILESTIENIIKYVRVKNYEIIICNDHSTDKTQEIATKLSKKYKQIRVLKNTEKPGFGNVIRFGLRNAHGKYVLPMMADLCDEPKTVNVMYKKIEEGYDVVVGSRYIKGGSKNNVKNHFKSLCSWGVGFIGHHVQRIQTHDTTNAFKMMTKEAFLAINPKSNNFDISLEMTIKLHKKGFNITEVPTIWTDRTEGLSKFKIVRVAKKYIRWLLK